MADSNQTMQIPYLIVSQEGAPPPPRTFLTGRNGGSGDGTSGVRRGSNHRENQGMNHPEALILFLP